MIKEQKKETHLYITHKLLLLFMNGQRKGVFGSYTIFLLQNVNRDETNMLDMTGSRLLDSAIVQIPTQLLHLSTTPCDVTTISVEALTLIMQIMRYRPPHQFIYASSASQRHVTIK